MLKIEHGMFTPLVFGTNGGMGRECHMFVKQLATMLAEKTEVFRHSDLNENKNFDGHPLLGNNLHQRFKGTFQESN